METSQLTGCRCPCCYKQRQTKSPHPSVCYIAYEKPNQDDASQMNWPLLLPHNPAAPFRPAWPLQDIRSTFFKCVRWQLEETMDKITCPYHYYCDSIYPGDYPPAVDILVLAFTAATYLATLLIMVADMLTRGQICVDQWKRLLLPSGPVSLPVFLFVLAKGLRINALFPLFLIGPAILHLVYISALTLDNGADKDIKYVFFEASTMSGILHASLNLDSIILPYYTGFDALVASTFSGECPSCVCRNDPLVVGGRFMSYRGWSATTFVVVCALCARIICRVYGEKATRKGMVFRTLLEGLAWIFITLDCVYLTRNSPSERTTLQAAAYGGIVFLVFIHVLKLARRWQLMFYAGNELEKV